LQLGPAVFAVAGVGGGEVAGFAACGNDRGALQAHVGDRGLFSFLGRGRLFGRAFGLGQARAVPR